MGCALAGFFWGLSSENQGGGSGPVALGRGPPASGAPCCRSSFPTSQQVGPSGLSLGWGSRTAAFPTYLEPPRIPDRTWFSHTWGKASNRVQWEWEAEPQTRSDGHVVPSTNYVLKAAARAGLHTTEHQTEEVSAAQKPKGVAVVQSEARVRGDPRVRAD